MKSTDIKLNYSSAVAIFIVYCLTIFGTAAKASSNIRCSNLFSRILNKQELFTNGKIIEKEDNENQGQHQSWIVKFSNSKVLAKIKELPYTMALTEVIAYQISEKTGINLFPLTVYRKIESKHYSVQEYFENNELVPINELKQPNPENLQLRLFEFLLQNVDANSGDLIWNPITKIRKHIDAGASFEPDTLDPSTDEIQLKELEHLRLDQLPINERPKPLFIFKISPKEYLINSKFYDDFLKLDAMKVYADLPYADTMQRIGILESRWRMELAQQIIRIARQKANSSQK